ncbi:penicillin acylase family protein [Kineosporia sp. NBRC 101677]|uniref:penicillin acylase family protein n=1 Tax=Kineosporia sp. NBRC 101677 TaxID=3032197 RepID=UPI002554E26C|nr:penicillin acylase family protein [Kineosporia sp. NBRC 101677]
MTRRRALRVTAIGSAVVAVIAVVVVAVLAVTLIRRPLPDRGGEVSMPGLSGEARVIRDDRGVPQIYADNAEDLFRVQGYVSAQDRFFEMDLRRHITAGRLSELVGEDEDALTADKLIRTLGWRQVAEEEFTKATESTKAYLEAYAAGVNEYIEGRSKSELNVTYTILERSHDLADIEPWTPVDSLAWIKAMAWDLRSNYGEELQRAQAINTVRNAERVEQLFPDYPYEEHPPIIEGEAADGNQAGSGAQANPGKGNKNNNQNNEQNENPDEEQGTSPEGTPTPDPSATGTPSSSATVENASLVQQSTVLSSDAAQQALSAATNALDGLPDVLGGSSEGNGSNSWVVAGDLTESGLPLLANDPHLGVSAPGIWTQVGLHCNTVSEACPFDVSGYTFAGLPGVVIGHNARISWGLTNLGPDVSDFFLENVNGESYLVDGNSQPLETRPETIKVAGGDPVTINVRSTKHGPLISDVLTDVAKAGQTSPVPGEKILRGSTYAVALSWTALSPGTSMEAILGLNVAQDFESFRKAVQKLDAPAQSVIYADVDGNIGYQAPGRVPLRGKGDPQAKVPADGTWPQIGWDSRYDWTGFVKKRDLPWVENPRSGYIVAANQAVTGPDGTAQLTSDWDYGFRSQRIQKLIEGARADHPITMEDMREVQNDTYNAIAEMLVPTLLELATTTDEFTQSGVELLEGWDYMQPTDSAAAAYFNTVWAKLLDLTFADELPEGFRADGGDRWFQVVSMLMDDPKDEWWDDGRTDAVVESRDEVLRRALTQARLELTQRLGKDPDKWRWGKLHRVTLEQTPLGGEGLPSLLRELVNQGPYEAPGGSSIVNAFSWDASAGDFSVTAAPSMRMIVDMSNLDNSRWVNQSGVSGHPLDKHYDDQVGAWLKGEDFAWPFTADAVKAASDQEQTFKPES